MNLEILEPLRTSAANTTIISTWGPNHVEFELRCGIPLLFGDIPPLDGSDDGW